MLAGDETRWPWPQMGRAQSICQQSPVEPDWQSAGTDSPTRGRTCSSSTSMEGTGMVPSADGDAGGNPFPDTPEEGPHHSHTSGQHPRGGPPQLAVWVSSGSATRFKVSEGATKLLLASWRRKSSKTYDSLSERHREPVSYPIVVINFLPTSFNRVISTVKSIHIAPLSHPCMRR